MSRAEFLVAVSTSRSQRMLPRTPAILIAVPAVNDGRRRRLSATASAQNRSWQHQTRRPRRRLRRGVRLAGCAVLALAPFASACTLGWSSRPARIVACSIPETPHQAEGGDGLGAHPGPGSRNAESAGTSNGSAAAVVLSIEPAAAAPGALPAVPVIFPGYVLPDDSIEDRSHEGS
jgi:hypothetical protein